MKVTTILASVRYSKALGDGSHKTIELAVEATLTPQEEWHKAAATLYHQLGDQLKACGLPSPADSPRTAPA
jgi:hypothetical protein